jgi:hypothetical protein
MLLDGKQDALGMCTGETEEGRGPRGLEGKMVEREAVLM